MKSPLSALNHYRGGVPRFGPLPRSLGAFLALLAPLAACAASVTHYGVLKGKSYSQTSAAAPATAESFQIYSFVRAVAEGTVLVAMAQPPGQPIPLILGNADDPALFEASMALSSSAELESAYPNGTYSFTFYTLTGQESPALTLTGDSYPDIPVMNNYAAGQSLDAAQAFTIGWNPATQLTATDFIMVEVSQDGDTLLDSPPPWEAGALAGTTTSYTIPAGTLDPSGSDPEVRISFIKVTARNTAALAGATGVSGYYRTTDITLQFKGGGTGGDTTPPMLVTPFPQVGAINVAANVSVTFTFSEAMQPRQDIFWTGVASPASFAYAWSQDAKTLTCVYAGGFAPGATILWQLQPTGFADLAGNALAAVQNAGMFIVATGGTSGCSNDLEQQPKTFTLARYAAFVQATAGAPIPQPQTPEGDPAAAFYATFSPTSYGGNLTGAEAGLPSGQVRTLTGLSGMYFYSQMFSTVAQLEAAYPAGSYTARLLLAGGGNTSQSLSLGAGPNDPHCANFDAAQAVNAAADFVLRWDALASAGPNDRLELVIHGDQGTEVFRLPDECATPAKPLANTATSATIPANTLQPGRTYAADLTFIRVSDSKTGGSPSFSAFGGYAKTTHFTVKTLGGGGPNDPPRIDVVRITQDRHLEVEVTGSAGRTLTLLATENYNAWTPVGTATAPAIGRAVIRDSNLAAKTFRAYRVRSE